MSETYSKPHDPNKKEKEPKWGMVLSNIIIVLVLILGVYLYFTGAFNNSDESEELEAEKTTVLRVRNANPTDTVLVYLTLSGGDGFVSDVNGMFGIKSKKKLQGSFSLIPHQTVSYTCPTGKAVSGNISFWQPPRNCPYIGTTLYEFTLNNKGTVVNAQETVDISCVAGVNTLGVISMENGGNWTDNVHPDPVHKIENKALYNNSEISGVFPFGCTNCINQDGAPDCTGRPKYATPNTSKLCNVQRNAKDNGGLVLIAYLGKAP